MTVTKIAKEEVKYLTTYDVAVVCGGTKDEGKMDL
jgi:hypothetical protein